MLTFDAFAARVQTALEVELENPPTPSDGLFDVWALDSLQGFQLLVIVEDMAGCLVPPPELPLMLVAGDAYDYYCALVQTATTEV